MSFSNIFKTGDICDEQFCYHDIPDQLYPFDYDKFMETAERIPVFAGCSNVETGKAEYIRLHDLRHINASVMAYLGIPQKYAMERGGWDNVQTMDKIYQFTFKDAKKAVDDKINDFFTKLFEG